MIISILIDTSVLVAYANQDNQNHQKALDLMNSIMSGKFGSPLISDYIFDEAVTVCLARTKSKEKTKEFGDYLMLSEIQLVRITSSLFQDSWNIFCASSKISFTDATSLALLKIGIGHIATFDEALAKAAGSKAVKL